MIRAMLFRFKWHIFLAAGLSVISALASIGVVTLMTNEIGRLGTGGGSVAYSIEWFFLAIVTVVVFGVASQTMLSKLSSSIVFDMRKNMVKSILGTPYEKIERIGGHRVYATITEDVTSISQGLMLLPQFIYSFTTVVLCVAYLAYSSWQLFLVVASLLSVTVVVAQVLLLRGMAYLKQKRRQEDDMFSGFKALVEGGKELNVNAKRRGFFFKQVVVPSFDSIRTTTVKSEFIFILLSNVTKALVLCVIAGIVYGAKYLFSDISIEVVVGFVLIVLYMVEPLETVFDMFNDFGKFSVAVRKIDSLGLTNRAALPHRNTGARPVPQNWQAIDVRQLTYCYGSATKQGDKFTVGPVDLSVKKGTVVFLTGGNGSGKTTFAKVLAGLYAPASGSVFLDGKRIDKNADKTFYENIFSVIFSDFYLFNQVLDKTGALADDAIIARYLKRLKLDEKVTSHGGVLTSTNLSQGQKKRLAMLLSYVEDAPVCIFDEWAADQDAFFRAFFYQELLPELKACGKTVLVITHDDRYFHLCDQLLKFEYGRLVEQRSMTDAAKSVCGTEETMAR